MDYPPNPPITVESLIQHGAIEITRPFHDPDLSVRDCHVIDISHDISDPKFNDCTRFRYTGEKFVEVGGDGWLIIEPDQEAVIEISQFLLRSPFKNVLTQN